MNTLYKILFLSIVVITITSCVPAYYMANSAMEPIVFTKPLYHDTATVSSYIGGKFNTALDSAYNNSGETNSFGQIYWFRTHIQKYYNFSYGAFGYLGNYKVTAVKELTGNKSYFGGGVSGEFCVNIPVDAIDIRIIGLKGTMYYEDGNYRRFKMLARDQKLAITSTDLYGYNLSETFGMDIKLNKISSVGCYISNGMSGQLISGERFFTSSAVLNYQTKKFTLFLQSSSTWLRDLSTVFGIGGEVSVGLNYRL